MFKIVKRRESYKSKDTGEIRKVWRYYLISGNARIQIRPSFAADGKVLYALVDVDPDWKDTDNI